MSYINGLCVWVHFIIGFLYLLLEMLDVIKEIDQLFLSSGLRYKGNVLCDNRVPMSSIVSFS